jgi:hypothetical protein
MHSNSYRSDLAHLGLRMASASLAACALLCCAVHSSLATVLPVAPPLAPPGTALYSGAWLVEARRALVQGEEWAVAAWKAMEADASEWLDTPSLSVMQKSVLPPSGSKHDYMSLDKYVVHQAQPLRTTTTTTTGYATAPL